MPGPLVPDAQDALQRLKQNVLADIAKKPPAARPAVGRGEATERFIRSALMHAQRRRQS